MSKQTSESDRRSVRNWLDLVKASGTTFPYGVGFVILLLVAVGLVFLVGDDADAPSNDSDSAATQIDQDDPAAAEPDDAHAAADVPDFVDADGTTPLSGTWTMFSRNSEGTDNPAFTLRFSGLNGGSVEVLNDETEFDTWVELDGDDLRFGFTRMMERVNWPEKSEFRGTQISDGQFLGNWYRDDWECSGGPSPECVTGPGQSSFTSWIEQDS